MEGERTAIGGDELVARPRGWSEAEAEANYEGADEKEEERPCWVPAGASLGFCEEGIGDLFVGLGL
jgi:hypothetical protein